MPDELIRIRVGLPYSEFNGFKRIPATLHGDKHRQRVKLNVIESNLSN
jgi:hypothetical protein